MGAVGSARGRWEVHYRVHPSQTDWIVLPMKSKRDAERWYRRQSGQRGLITETRMVRVESVVVARRKVPEA